MLRIAIVGFKVSHALLARDFVPIGEAWDVSVM